MVLFLTTLPLLTIGALSLFIFPILPLNRGRRKAKIGRQIYICIVFFLFAVFVPALYGKHGKMLMPDYPLATRDTLQAEENSHRMAYVRRLERYLDATPDDDIVWKQLAHSYRAAGYYGKAAAAYRNAIEWGIPEDISGWHSLAETLIQANNGRITGEAQKALENVLRYRPDDPKAIYFLGLARLQNKEPQKALALWRFLEQSLSAEDPWLTVIHERIGTLQKLLQIDPRTIKPQAPVPLK